MTAESALLRRIYDRSAALAGVPGVLVGPGDDCAVIRLGDSPDAPPALLTVDQLVEGRHFESPGDSPTEETIDRIARKAVARSVSDIAAMGGEPRFALAAGALRDSFTREDALFDALHRWAGKWGCPLVGGDIARVAGPTVLSVVVIGAPHRVRGPVLRSGAKPGDAVYITGALGGSFASGRHMTFEPRISVGTLLCDTLGDRLQAMIDVSDGAGRDAGRIAEASGVRIELDAQALPLHPGVAGWREALSDGEEYELLFTASGGAPPNAAPGGVPITRIGRVVEGSGCVAIEASGAEHDIANLGWDHAP